MPKIHEIHETEAIMIISDFLKSYFNIEFEPVFTLIKDESLGWIFWIYPDDKSSFLLDTLEIKWSGSSFLPS